MLMYVESRMCNPVLEFSINLLSMRLQLVLPVKSIPMLPFRILFWKYGAFFAVKVFLSRFLD
jgi:hypothetical protein